MSKKVEEAGVPADAPEGFQYANRTLWGMRKSHPGLFEIKYHIPKRSNSMNGESMWQVAQLIKSVQDDENVKVILLHGGKFYSSGNDLTAFSGMLTDDPEVSFAKAKYALKTQMAGFCMETAKSKKPIVAVVRGQAMGIAFTHMPHCTFIYSSPDAKWQTPFMKSSQTQEGGSTYTFPQIFGTRLANEILLTDRPINAEEALKTGFTNGIIDKFDKASEWFDPSIIPVIPTLLKSDYKTLVTSMEQFIASKNIPLLESVIQREADALLNHWQDPEFLPKMLRYLKTFQKQGKKKSPKAKM